MLTDIGHRIQIVILLLSALTSYHVGFGQIPYTYNCRDYVSTDDNRAPQSACSYNDNANSFPLNALPGENNVAFEMNRAKDNAYYTDLRMPERPCKNGILTEKIFSESLLTSPVRTLNHKTYSPMLFFL